MIADTFEDDDPMLPATRRCPHCGAVRFGEARPPALVVGGQGRSAEDLTASTFAVIGAVAALVGGLILAAVLAAVGVTS